MSWFCNIYPSISHMMILYQVNARVERVNASLAYGPYILYKLFSLKSLDILNNVIIMRYSMITKNMK